MVGVAVSLVMKFNKKFQDLVIQISHNRNDDTATVESLRNS